MNAERRAPTLRARLAKWLAPWREALRQMPPEPGEAALGAVLGGPVLALVNGVAIAVTVAKPRAGWGLRVAHHFFAALEIIGVAASLALLTWALLRVRVDRLRRLGWVLLAVVATAGMYGILDHELERQAFAALNGTLSWLLYPGYLVLCGLAVPAAHLVGAIFARVRGGRWVGLGIAVIAMVLSHAFQRDDHPGVHAATLWIAACVAGSCLAPLTLSRVRGRARVIGGAVMAAIAVLALAWAPPNGVRLELFREPGAVAPWVLAQVLWRPPSIAAHADAPIVAPLDPAIRRQARAAMAREPVVVLITIDAFRADVLRSGKYDKVLPVLASLRDQGAYFPRFTSAGSQTSVSLTSMFSSRYFSQLYWEPYGEGRGHFLYAANDDTPRFPAVLTAAGIDNASYLGLLLLQGRFGISRGFSEEHAIVDDRRHAVADELMRPLLARLESAGGGPHFFYAHLMEPHEPYDRGRLKTGDEFDRYVSEIGVVDGWLGRVVRALRKRFRDRGYLLVSSDHGEAFGEHGTRFHTKTLYEELVAVPFVMWGPRIPASRIEVRAGGIDIGPTVLDLFDLAEPEGFMGRSLLPLARGLVTELPRPVLSEGRLRRVLYQDDLKVIEDGLHKTVEVYDLQQDPGELVNLFETDRARVEALVAAERAFFAEHELRRPGYKVPYKP